MTVAAPAAEPVQAAAQQTVQAAPQGDLEAPKASIAEGEYKFRGNALSRSLIFSIIGNSIIFKLKKESLDIENEGKDNITIPYTDLKSYRYEDKTRIGYIIGSLFYILLGVLLFWFGLEEASLPSSEGGVVVASIFIGLLSLVVAALMIFFFASGTDFIAETHSGQTFKTKMRRIRGKEEADRDAFVCDLNTMLQLNNQPVLTTAVLKKKKTELIIGTIAALVVIAIAIVVTVPSSTSKSSTSLSVSDVKDGTLTSYTSTTIGNALKNYSNFDNTSWKEFDDEVEVDNGDYVGNIVEFGATLYYIAIDEDVYCEDASCNLIIEFYQDEDMDDDEFEIWGIYIEEQRLNDVDTEDFLDCIYDDEIFYLYLSDYGLALNRNE